LISNVPCLFPLEDVINHKPAGRRLFLRASIRTSPMTIVFLVFFDPKPKLSCGLRTGRFLKMDNALEVFFANCSLLFFARTCSDAVPFVLLLFTAVRALFCFRPVVLLLDLQFRGMRLNMWPAAYPRRLSPKPWPLTPHYSLGLDCTWYATYLVSRRVQLKLLCCFLTLF